MEQNERRRPGDHVPKERPRTPASGPRAPRTRTGSASAREAARSVRMAEPARQPQTRRAPDRQTPPRRRPADREPDAQLHRGSGPREEVPPRQKKKAKKPRRVYNTNFGFKFLILLAVVAVIVLSMIIFFKVKHIQVILPGEETGEPAAYYTREEIAAASGIHIDDNLLSLSKATAAARIHAELPYVNEIQIKKQLPGTVVITFTEFDVTYGIQDETGGWWLMSREGRILEAVEEQEARNHLRVTGMPIQTPQAGEFFKPAATEGADMSEIAAKQKVVLEVIPALEKTDFVKNLDRVDVSTSYDLTLWWTGDRYEIRLGTTEELDYKLRFLQATLENADIQRRSGTIDLTFNEDDKVHFLEFR